MANDNTDMKDRVKHFNKVFKTVFIKRCPFCKGNARINEWKGGITVEVRCDSCGAKTKPFYMDKEAAIKAWNRRITDG